MDKAVPARHTGGGFGRGFSGGSGGCFLARPFAAHCWVQYGDIVFNDRVEEVGGYTPIMVV